MLVGEGSEWGSHLLIILQDSKLLWWLILEHGQCVCFDFMQVEHKNALASDSFILSDPWPHWYLDVNAINVQVASLPSSLGPQSNTPAQEENERGQFIPDHFHNWFLFPSQGTFQPCYIFGEITWPSWASVFPICKTDITMFLLLDDSKKQT